MKCPNCGNEVYKLLDYAIVRCTNCFSLWDPYVYPGFPEPDVPVGEIWDTSDSGDETRMSEEHARLDDFDDEDDDFTDWGTPHDPDAWDEEEELLDFEDSYG